MPLLIGALALLSGAVSPAAEDPAATDKFWESTQKFDDLLRNIDSQEALTRLCDQFGGLLEKLGAPSAGNSEFLTAAITREKNRLALVKATWLKNPSQFRRLRLDPGWIKKGQYKEATADFKRVLGIKPKFVASELRPHLREGFGANAKILGRPWLCPLDEFVDSVSGKKGLSKASSARVKVGMPGFPANSFYYHSYDGNFTKLAGSRGGTFNRMYVVTDEWEQVVAVQFTCEAPKEHSFITYGGLGIFNFVQFRRKGSQHAYVRYLTTRANGITRIYTVLMDRQKAKEINVLMLPEPTRHLIQFNLGQR